MQYTHKLRRLTLIWDGADNGITDNDYEYRCPVCSQAGSFTLKDAVELMSLSEDLQLYIESESLVSLSQCGYEVKKGVPAYVISTTCGNCNSQVWIIVGIKEVQPQRYNCYLKSVICKINV